MLNSLLHKPTTDRLHTSTRLGEHRKIFIIAYILYNRDLKPENVLLGCNGHVKPADLLRRAPTTTHHPRHYIFGQAILHSANSFSLVKYTLRSVASCRLGRELCLALSFELPSWWLGLAWYSSAWSFDSRDIALTNMVLWLDGLSAWPCVVLGFKP